MYSSWEVGTSLFFFLFRHVVLHECPSSHAPHMEDFVTAWSVISWLSAPRGTQVRAHPNKRVRFAPMSRLRWRSGCILTIKKWPWAVDRNFVVIVVLLCKLCISRCRCKWKLTHIKWSILQLYFFTYIFRDHYYNYLIVFLSSYQNKFHYTTYLRILNNRY